MWDAKVTRACYEKLATKLAFLRFHELTKPPDTERKPKQIPQCVQDEIDKTLKNLHESKPKTRIAVMGAGVGIRSGKQFLLERFMRTEKRT